MVRRRNVFLRVSAVRDFFIVNVNEILQDMQTK